MLFRSTIDTQPPYRSLVAPQDLPPSLKEAKNDLFNSLYSTDIALREFFEGLKAKNLFDEKTLIIVTADHSPNHGEEYLKWSGLNNFDPAAIPIVFVTPGKNPFGKLDVSQFSSQIDLAPTLMTVMGAPLPNSFQGRNLLEPVATSVALSNKSANLYVRTKDESLMFPMHPSGDQQLENALPRRAVRKWFWNHNGLLE